MTGGSPNLMVSCSLVVILILVVSVRTKDEYGRK
jgi:hypothetical protein